MTLPVKRVVSADDGIPGDWWWQLLADEVVRGCQLNGLMPAEVAIKSQLGSQA
jgi:hypothetical protein